jgi:hypothetical protein
LASDDTDADPTRVAKNAPRVEAKRSDPGTAEIPSLASDTDDFDPTKVAKNPPAFRAEEPQTFKLRLRDHLAARLAERPRAAAKAAVPASAAVAREPSAVDVASGIPRVVRRDPKAPVVDKAAIIPARRAPRREAIVPFTERATIPAENERRGVGVDVSEPERVGVVVRGPALAERLQQGEPRVSGPPLHRSPQALEHPIPSMPPAPGLGASPSPRAAVPPRRVPAAPPATRTLVLVALVSVVCLAIFVTGLVLFITEP